MQAGAGIAATVTPAEADTPGALPCQLLDHGTGHLMAAAALLGLAARERGDGARHYRFALARTSAWLLDLPRAEPKEPATIEPRMTTFGDVSVAAPAGALDGERLEWSTGPARYGADRAEFGD